MGHPAVRDADLVDDCPGLRGEPAALASTASVIEAGSACGPACGEFPGVQRVALRGADHRRDPVRAGGVGREQAGYQLGDLAVGQPPQPEPGHLGPALQLGEPLPDAAGQFLLPERADQHDRLGRAAGPPGRRATRGRSRRPSAGPRARARPVTWPPGPPAAQDAHEQAVPGGQHVPRAVVGQQPSRLITQRGHEGSVGQRRACQRRRLADQDLRPAGSRRGLGAQFLDEPGLADASRPGKQQHLRAAGHRQRVGGQQRLPLGDPSHDRRGPARRPGRRPASVLFSGGNRSGRPGATSW